MARLKDRVPVQEDKRFLSRCAKEEEKLCLSIATKLQEDMKRMYEEEIFADLIVKLRNCEIKLHKFVINSRSPEIYERLCQVAIETHDNILTLPDWVDQTEFKRVFKSLYTTRDRSFDDLILNAEDLDNNTALVKDALAALRKREISAYDTEKENVNPVIVEDGTIGKLTQNDCEKISLSENEEKSITLTSTNLPVSDNVSCVDTEEGKASTSPTVNKDHHMTDNQNDAVMVEDDCVEDEAKQDKHEESLPELTKITCDQSLPHKACDSLGEALLSGHLQELNCDCTILVSGAKLKANRCVLAARSEYFSAMLCGSWVESDANEISLEDVSPPVMQQILLYLYGGVMDIDPTVSMELIKVGDMYGMEGLNSLGSYNLRKRLCHFFHKPCSECESGVLDVLMLCETYNMPDLRDKCLKWINNHMAKVWRNKAFATLPPEILDLCCNTAVNDLGIHDVLETMLECQKLNRNIPRLKWSEPVLSAITRLMDGAIEYTACHFYGLLNSHKFVDIDKSLAYQMGLLEEIFDTVIKSLPVAGACQVFHRLCELREATLLKDICWSEEFCLFIQSLYQMCESFMKLHIHQLAHTKDWDVLSKEVQTHLMKSANYVCIIGISKDRKAPPKLTSMQKDKGSSAHVVKALQEQKHIPKSKTLSEKSGMSVKAKGSTADKVTRSISRKPNVKDKKPLKQEVKVVKGCEQGSESSDKGDHSAGDQCSKDRECGATGISASAKTEQSINSNADNCNLIKGEKMLVRLPSPIVFSVVIQPEIRVEFHCPDS